MRYTKMDPKWKREWVKALRLPVDEGGYLQGREQLVKSTLDGGDRFCCLGVLKNILIEHGHGTWNDKVDPYSRHSFLYEDAGQLSDQDMELVGLAQTPQDRLVMLNDEKDQTFIEIADWIERVL